MDEGEGIEARCDQFVASRALLAATGMLVSCDTLIRA